MNGLVRSKRHFDFGDQCGHLLRPILDNDDACRAAATSCHFMIQGPESVGRVTKNWGRWVRTSLQTFGVIPTIRHAWQIDSHGMIRADSAEAANLILDCFGLTIEAVYERFGEPTTGVKYSLDLIDVIQALAPEILGNTRQVAKTA